MLKAAGVGHPGGALSMVDLITALYFKELRIRPDQPNWPDRDRFVLSKGHACLAWYAALSRRGYFPRDWLWTFAQLGSPLQKHPDMHKTPGVDYTAGSLGQGLSLALGMALAARLDRRSYRVYTILGDGEIQEGQVWEAVMAAKQFGAGNLVAIVDHNGLQIDGPVSKVMAVDPLVAKFAAFGWEAVEIDGHDLRAILGALDRARSATGPFAIVADTIKGKGVSYMEGRVEYHSKVPAPELLEAALDELSGVGR